MYIVKHSTCIDFHKLVLRSTMHCMYFYLATIYHLQHVYTHSPLTPTSPVSLVILICTANRGFSSTGGGCGCDRCSPIGHRHHSDGVACTTV